MKIINKNLIALMLVMLIAFTSLYMSGCDKEDVIATPDSVPTSIATVDETANVAEVTAEATTHNTTASESTTSTTATEATVGENVNNNSSTGNSSDNKPADKVVVTEGNTSPQHIHSYGWVTKKATCTIDGYTEYSCACGAVYTDDYVEAYGHNWSSWETIKEATTESEGKRQKVCSTCDKVKSETIDKILGPYDVPAVGNVDLLCERILYYISLYRSSDTYSPNCMYNYALIRAEQASVNYSHDEKDMSFAEESSGANINGECLGCITNLDYSVDEAAYEIVEQFRLGSPIYGSAHWDIITNPNFRCLSAGVYFDGMHIYTCIATSYREQ